MLYPFTRTAVVTAPFGYSPQYGPTYHEGIDYAMPVGTPLRASITGTVVFAGTDNFGAGRAVSIQSGSTIVKCFHMDSIAVRYGQKVKAGQNIGTSGNTGNSTGPHLHFQVEKNYVPVNPAPLFNKPKKGNSGGIMAKVSLEIARIIAHGVGGRNGVTNKTNALSGSSDKDLKKNHVGKTLNATWIRGWYRSAEGKAFRSKLAQLKKDADKVPALEKKVKELEAKLKKAGDPTSNDEQVRQGVYDKIKKALGIK